MKAIFLTVFVLLTASVISQNQAVDSLRKTLNNYSSIDTNRIQTLLMISELLKDTEPKESLIAAQNAKSLAQKLKNKYLEARAIYMESEAYFKIGEVDKAISNCKHAIIILQQLGITEKEFVCLNAIGIYFSRTGMNDSAIYYYNLSIEKARTLKDTSVIHIPLDNISVAYSDMGDNDKAIETRKKSLEIYTQKHDRKGMGGSLMWIGNFIREKGDYDESLEYYNKALKELKLHDELRAYCHANIGVIYKRIKSYDKAIDNYRSALTIFKKNNDDYNLATLLHSIANVYYEQCVYNRVDAYFDSADTYYKESINIREKINDNYGLAQSYAVISDLYNKHKKFDEAEIFLDKGIYYNDIIKNDYNKINLLLAKGNLLYERQNFSEANHYFEKALTYAKQFSSLEDIKIAYQNISNSYYNLGNYSNAYNYLLEYNKASDSLLNKENLQTINDLNVKYETDKKQQQIALLNKDKQLSEAKNQRQKTQMQFGVAFAIIVLSSTIAIFYLRQKQEKALYEKQVSVAELGALRARMDPHFIDNSLFSILGFLKKNDNEKASNYLLKFSELIGAILLKSGKSEILLSEELDIVRNYLDTQKINEYAFDYEINVDESIDTDDILFPSLMLQPFAENAVKHGFDKINYKGKLTINILKVNDLLVCEIIDNGKGRKEELNMDNNKNSVSIALNKQRIEIYNRGRNKNASFNITDLVQGVKVELKVPIQYNFA